jgi:DNA adenine methylase
MTVSQLRTDGTNVPPAVLRYPGSKWTLARRIVSEFQPHYHYIEPFFGSGAVFFTKEPVPHELVNDRLGSIVNLWRVLRDQTDELCWLLEATPWSRDEYDMSDEITGDPLEDARRFVVRVWQAHASDLAKKTGWKNRGVHQRAGGMSHRWQKVPDQLRKLAWRLSDAEIENRPALEVIKRHSKGDALIYADPPYPHDVRTQHMYEHEMTIAEHEDLVEALRAHAGPVVVSGYAHPLYDEAFAHWKRITTKAPKAEKGAARTEVLWVKPSAEVADLPAIGRGSKASLSRRAQRPAAAQE